jgi:hypothetical protein
MTRYLGDSGARSSITALSVATIGDENAHCAPAHLNEGAAPMKRCSFENLTTFSLKDEANDLRKQAQGMSPSIRRDDILRPAQQAEAIQDLLQRGHQADTVAHLDERISSPELQPPK